MLLTFPRDPLQGLECSTGQTAAVFVRPFNIPRAGIGLGDVQQRRNMLLLSAVRGRLSAWIVVVDV